MGAVEWNALGNNPEEEQVEGRVVADVIEAAVVFIGPCKKRKKKRIEVSNN